MKRLLPFAPLLLLAALLLSPAAALSGAKQGLDIWWGQVFPALLPSFICVRLAQKLGLLHVWGRHPKGQLAAAVGFSLVSGAPNGAKLLWTLTKDGSLSPKAGERLLPLVNSVSPMFLLSIIASQLLKNKALFLPMSLAFYGCILGGIAICMPRHNSESICIQAETVQLFSQALAAAIESSMLDMLRIGGCILFICTLLSLLSPLMPSVSAYAALAGCLEVNVGASAISKLPMAMRMRTSLLVGTSAFGGLSLALQTVCCCPTMRLIPYIVRKLLLGAVVGLTCYLMFPLFPQISAAFANRQMVLERTISFSALLLSSTLSIAFIAVLSLMVGPRKTDRIHDGV